MLQVSPRNTFVCVGVLFTALAGPLTAASGADATGQTPERDLAGQILRATELQGGLIVHLGCGSGKLAAALGAEDRFLVHGLDADADNVRRAREYLQQSGLYGRVSAERFDGERLPYADNLVNLLVAETLDSVKIEEALRVLAPGGVLYAKQEGKWRKTVKPRPADIDEWTHFLHDAGGNAVAHDQVVGPPGQIQWTAPPRHDRSHEHLPNVCALVSAGGRIFYLVDEAPIASIRQAPQWRLVARDAFNGLLLWKKPVGGWFPHLVNWGQTPPQLQRKLVAVGDRVYVTLGLHAPLSVVDAATGETLDVFENTSGTEEIVCHQGILLLVTRSVTDERVAELAQWRKLVAAKESPLDARETAEPLVKRLRAVEARGQQAVLALDAYSGRLLWKKAGADASGLRTYTLSADADRVFYQNGKDVVCLDLKTGQELWSVSSAPLRMVYNGNLVCADGRMVTLLSAETGQPRWQQPTLLVDIRDAFIAGGSLWLGGFKPIEGKRGPAWGPYFATQRDLATGEVLRHLEPENPGHHHRCYQNKATDRYIFAGRRGTELIDLQSGEVMWNSWARGACKYGVMPCNGLLYVPPHPCACYVAAKLTGFNALATRRDEGPGARDEGPRLEPGPAYDPSIPRSESPILNSSDWPTYRCDAGRSGFTRATVSATLRPRWQAEVGETLTAPTVFGGKVFVASVDEHAVCAIDADSGRPIWRFTAGARVDSPPTLYRDRALLGCRDGYVYSLRTSDGSLAWRLRAARRPRRIVAAGQLESASPVHGSVLVRDGAAYFTAGRSSYLDGGTDLYRVEPGSGKILSKTPVYSPDPQTGRQPPQSAPFAMPGARADVLTGDDGHVYLRDMVFDRDGRILPEGSPHLFTLTDFLDDSWAHRSYWIFGKNCSVSTGCSGRDRKLIYGRLLVFDDSTIYGYGRRTVHWSNQLQDGPYRLFAVNRDDGAARWENSLPIQVRAMLLADKVLFLAGPAVYTGLRPQRDEPQAALLMAVSASDGTELARYPLGCLPVFDGMAAAAAHSAGRQDALPMGRLYVSLENGQLVCLDGSGTGNTEGRRQNAEG